MPCQILLSRVPFPRTFFSSVTSAPFSVKIFQWLVWLLALHLVLVLPPHAGVLAEIEVECFDCSWQSSSPQNIEKGQEFCLPDHFQRDKVKTVTCSQGCMITSMYENDPDGPVTTLELRSGGSNDGDDPTTSPQGQRQGQNPNRPPMSFFTRGCPKDNTRKSSGCEEKSYQQHVVREECFCTTPLCNGTGGMLTWRSSIMVLVIFVVLFILYE